MTIKIKGQTNLNGSVSIKAAFFTLAILLSCNCVRAQENKIKFDVPARNPFDDYKKPPARNYTEAAELVAGEIKPAPGAAFFAAELERKNARLEFVEIENKPRVKEKDAAQTDVKDVSNQENSGQIKTEEKFHWKPALVQSGIVLGIQHGFRMSQERTRRELGGPFFRDWAQSVKSLGGWRDGDKFFINYVAHPIQGGATGRIFVNNSDAAKKQEFGKSKEYWESRFKAMAWSAFWSTQFELGPISEASIGNVGKNKNDPHKMAWVDLVVTPTVGTGLLIGEDAIDRYVLKNWLERKSGSKTRIKVFRSLLTPTTSIANLLRLKVPWKRDNRPL